MAPGAKLASTTRFTCSCSASSLHAILMRCGFLGSLVTARHRQSRVVLFRAHLSLDNRPDRSCRGSIASFPFHTRGVDGAIEGACKGGGVCLYGQRYHRSAVLAGRRGTCDVYVRWV